MRYSVRPYRRADSDLLVSLHQVTLPADELPDFSVGHWWVAWCAGDAVGFAGLNPDGYLCRSGVVPAHRGRGLQKRLIRARLKKAADLGLQWVFTDTTHNPPSSNSLIACGFRLYTPEEPWGIDTTLYWRRKVP